MQVVIFAGGKGSRLLSLSETLPKPLLDINGYPLILYVMKVYSEQKIKNFVLLTGYMHEKIEAFFEKYRASDDGFYYHPMIGKVHINIVDTYEDSTTAKRLYLAKDYLEDRFFLTYADGVADIDLNKLLAQHINNGTTLTITCVKKKNQFGVVSFSDHKVTSFSEKSDYYWINGGFMVAEKRILTNLVINKMLEEDTFSHLLENSDLGVYIHDGYWKSVDNLQDKLDLEYKLKS